MDKQKYSDENTYLLTVIDIVSKYAWTVPLKRKTGSEVFAAFSSILETGRVPKNLHVDAGSELYNSIVKKLLERYKIHLYSTFTHLKASICEGFTRTLKTWMWKKFTLQGNHKWLSILPKFTEEYNIGMSPEDVNKDNEKQIVRRINEQQYYKIKYSKPKFKLGDIVKISKYKHVFEKGYKPNFTTENFTVSRVHYTRPFTYASMDSQNESIQGKFYEEEVQKTKYPNVYLLENVIRKRGNKIFVKWLGFSDEHNSWINKEDL